MREQADHGRDIDRIYKAFHGAAVRFGERHITNRIPSFTQGPG
jgi:hypothetical protein